MPTQNRPTQNVEPIIEQPEGTETAVLVHKGYGTFGVSQALLDQTILAVRDGEQKARSTGEVQTFEVSRKGHRQLLVIGRIYVVPPAVAENVKNFPTALLYGALVSRLNPNEVIDLVTEQIGGSEFDEYSTADMSEIKDKLFKNEEGKYDCLVFFNPAWTQCREQVFFRFTKDEDMLANYVRHLIFSAYYNPALSSAWDLLMEPTDALQVSHIDPKTTFPWITEANKSDEGVNRSYPDLQRKTASKCTCTLTGTALHDKACPEHPSNKKESAVSPPHAGYGGPMGGPPKMAFCKRTIADLKADVLEGGELEVLDELSKDLKSHVTGETTPMDAVATTTASKKGAVKVAYVAECPGHQNSKGEAAPWCIKQHESGKILESFKTKSEADAGLVNMESHKGSLKEAAGDELRVVVKDLGVTGRITNVREDDQGENIFTVALDDPTATPDGFYTARGFELAKAGVYSRSAATKTARMHDCPGCGRTVINNDPQATADGYCSQDCETEFKGQANLEKEVHGTGYDAEPVTSGINDMNGVVASPDTSAIDAQNDMEAGMATGPFEGDLVKYDVEDFVALINSKYGWSVSAQAESILEGADPNEQNSNALRYIYEFAKSKGEVELANYLRGYFTNDLGTTPEDHGKRGSKNACVKTHVARGDEVYNYNGHDYRVSMWDERDRLNINLVDECCGEKDIMDLWDEDARSAIEDGFVDPRNLAQSMVEYAEQLGLLKKSQGTGTKKCDQCEMLRINGVPTHERGCPKAGRGKRSYLKTAGPMDVEHPEGSLGDKLRPFSKTDWYGYMGAESWSENDPPLIAEIKVTNWPEKDEYGDNPHAQLSEVVMIVDAMGVSLNGVNGAFHYSLPEKDAAVKFAEDLLAKQPVDIDQLEENGWEAVNFPEETLGDIEDRGRAEDYVEMAGGKAGSKNASDIIPSTADEALAAKTEDIGPAPLVDAAGTESVEHSDGDTTKPFGGEGEKTLTTEHPASEEKGSQDENKSEEKEANFSASLTAGFSWNIPGQVLREFAPDLQHEIVDYPNAVNSPMIEDIALVAAIDSALDSKQGFMELDGPSVSTSPAAGAGIGRDGKEQVLEGAPLRKENDIRGYGFSNEFYKQYEGVPGAYLAVAAHLKNSKNKKASKEEDLAQFKDFLKRAVGEVAASFIAIFKANSKSVMDMVKGEGEVQLMLLEGSNTESEAIAVASRVKHLITSVNDGDLKEAITEAFAQAAVWNENKENGFCYEVFVRAEELDTDSGILKYTFVTGTKGE